jgi:hypothetical protein
MGSVAIIVPLLIFWAFGLSLSRLYRIQEERSLFFHLAGVVGFSFVTVLLTALIQADYRPSSRFWVALVILTLACGAVLSRLTVRDRKSVV